MRDRASGRAALVTGATGFVGSHLARRLVAEGWEVHAIVRPDSDPAPLAPIQGRIRLHRHDGSMSDMLSLVVQSAPDVVFHLASLFLSSHRPEDVPRLVESNIAFGVRLAEAMHKAGVGRLVNTGTAWQHYQDESYNPVNLYAATKEAYRALLRYYIEIGALNVVHLELFDTYGPGDRRLKLFALLRNAAREGTVLRMSPGRQRIDLVYIDDAVSAFLCAAGRLVSGRCVGEETFSVCTGKPVALRDLVGIYCRTTGDNVRVEWGGVPYRPREVMEPWARGERLPGWLPEVDLETGIRRLHESVRGENPEPAPSGRGRGGAGK